jgi:hypothetical protein
MRIVDIEFSVLGCFVGGTPHPRICKTDATLEDP